MRPVLFHLGPVAIQSWGVMAILATVAGGLVLRSELRCQTGDGAAAFALTLAAAIGGLVGGRIYYLVEHLGHENASTSLSGTGFTWYGGFIVGAGAVLLVARRRGVPIRELLGAMAPALALAYAIARIGCQLAGDGTYGTVSDLPWAMSYPHGVDPTTQRVHPTPIYETLASLLIFAVLWRLRTRLDPLRIFGLYLLLSGSERVLVEFVRRNEQVLLGLTQPQIFGLVFVLLGSLLVMLPARMLPGPPGRVAPAPR